MIEIIVNSRSKKSLIELERKWTKVNDAILQGVKNI